MKALPPPPHHATALDASCFYGWHVAWCKWLQFNNDTQQCTRKPILLQSLAPDFHLRAVLGLKLCILYMYTFARYRNGIKSFKQVPIGDCCIAGNVCRNYIFGFHAKVNFFVCRITCKFCVLGLCRAVPCTPTYDNNGRSIHVTTYALTIWDHVVMETVAIDSCLRGRRVYKATWKPTLHEELQCRKEDDNPHDPYAVAVIKIDAIVGHVPWKVSAASYLFLEREENSVTCEVAPPSHYTYTYRMKIILCGIKLCVFGLNRRAHN